MNPNSTQASTDLMAGVAREVLGDDWTVVTFTNPDAPAIITDPAGAARATDSLLRLFEGGLDPCDGVILSAFLDPGLAELRARLAVPVVGIAEAAMQAAGRHGRFAILSTTPDLNTHLRELAVVYGEGDRLVDILRIQGDPYMVMGDPDLLMATLRAMLKDATDRLDVAAVIVGGGPLAMAARLLGAEATLPIVEPVPAAALALKAAIDAGTAR
ncbi:MAG: aspartate/glutamate racemase family protein [Thalassobaculaceae bacterium]|nr:aspartate/glutamate racemase family protein [Thalassobaculaceae bacterium]